MATPSCLPFASSPPRSSRRAHAPELELAAASEWAGRRRWATRRSCVRMQARLIGRSGGFWRPGEIESQGAFVFEFVFECRIGLD